MRISDWSSDVCSSDLSAASVSSSQSSASRPLSSNCSSKTKGGFGLPFFAEPPDCQETQIDRLRTSTARYVRERFIWPGQCFLALDRHGRGAALAHSFRLRSPATHGRKRVGKGQRGSECVDFGE